MRLRRITRQMSERDDQAVSASFSTSALWLSRRVILGLVSNWRGPSLGERTYRSDS